jgi:hypothetical protein
MPAGWFIPRIKLSADVLKKLMGCLDRAGAVAIIYAEETVSDQELYSDAAAVRT